MLGKKHCLRVQCNLCRLWNVDAMSSDNCHIDLISLVIELKGDKNIDEREILLKSIWNTIFIKYYIWADWRYCEPDFDIHSLCEFLDLCNIIFASDSELEAVKENSICTECTMADESFQRGEHLFDCNLLLGEVHYNSVGENLLIYFVCIVEGVVVDNFPVDFFIPIDDMFHVAGET